MNILYTRTAVLLSYIVLIVVCAFAWYMGMRIEANLAPHPLEEPARNAIEEIASLERAKYLLTRTLDVNILLQDASRRVFRSHRSLIVLVFMLSLPGAVYAFTRGESTVRRESN